MSLQALPQGQDCDALPSPSAGESEGLEGGTGEATLIAVEIIDTREGISEPQALSTLQHVHASTLAKDLTDQLESKLDLAVEDSAHYSLVLVISHALSRPRSAQNGGSTHTHYVRTFSPSECVAETTTSAVAAFCRKHGIPPAEHPSKAEQNSNPLIHGLPVDTSLRFFYKSCLHLPLSLEPGDHSGSDSDEERTEISLSDLAYIRHGADKRGFLLKRSKKDPNLWRKRCVYAHTSPPLPSPSPPLSLSLSFVFFSLSSTWAALTLFLSISLSLSHTHTHTQKVLRHY